KRVEITKNTSRAKAFGQILITGFLQYNFCRHTMMIKKIKQKNNLSMYKLKNAL
ncbi:hypothetical protein ACJX0J_028241, partial [Zea mays]